MSVDPVTGYIYVVFYDRRNYTTFLTDVYLARSTDGGQTFGNVKISQTAFSPIGNVFIGDYNGISVYNNKVRPIWTRMDYNNTSIWTAIIDSLTIGVTKINEIIPEDYYLSQNYPNPFNPETKISYKIPEIGFVSLKIFDIRGREIKTLVEENQSAGEYELNFNAGDLPSGTYFYRIQTNEFTDTKKMVLAR
ncbi:MAG: T9SS type A sorting domain-containing protein [Ignavibacteria bacterium]|nr:T9SS type A sorting domain-containing protein [Ignavibacteria bacterium]